MAIVVDVTLISGQSVSLEANLTASVRSLAESARRALGVLQKNYEKREKLLKSKRSLILTLIPDMFLHRTLIKNKIKNQEKTLRLKEIPTPCYDEGYRG